MPLPCFNTLIIHNRDYTDEAIMQVFDTFTKCGVTDFIFLIDLDFTKHSISRQNQKLKEIKTRLCRLRPRGIRTFAFYSSNFDKGVTFNKDFYKTYTSQKSPTVFLNIDFISAKDYNNLSQDINRLIYTLKVFPIFTHFDCVIEFIGGFTDISDTNGYIKLTKNQSIGFGFDLKYLFNPDKADIISKLISTNTVMIPTISGDISSYVSFPKDFEYLANTDNTYKSLCNRMRFSSLKII